jgi:hypothetical protein
MFPEPECVSVPALGLLAIVIVIAEIKVLDVLIGGGMRMLALAVQCTRRGV